MRVNVYRKLLHANSDAVPEEASRWIAKRRHCQTVNVPGASKFLCLRKCSQLPYVISLDANGGDIEVDTLQGTVGEPIGELPTPTYARRKFIGWQDSLGNAVTSETLMSSAVKTIYARWSEYVTVKFDPHTGSTDATTIDLAVGQPIEGLNQVAQPPSDDYIFIGWHDAPVGGHKVQNGDTYDGSYSVLYAMYQLSI